MQSHPLTLVLAGTPFAVADLTTNAATLEYLHDSGSTKPSSSLSPTTIG